MFTRRAKDIQRCLRNIESFTDNQARVVDCDYEELKSIKIEVAPKEGPYREGRFIFEIVMPLKYPDVPPDVSCSTNIYHPNIDPTGEELNVCLSLFDEWEPKFGLEDTIQGLLFLFYEPNLEDPLSPYFSGESFDSFENDVARSMRGEPIDGVQFDVVVDVIKLPDKEASGNIELEIEPITDTDTNAEASATAANETAEESDADTAGTLSDALDVVAVVKDMVDLVAADNECDTETLKNVKNNSIHSTEGAMETTVNDVPCEDCDNAPNDRDSDKTADTEAVVEKTDDRDTPVAESTSETASETIDASIAKVNADINVNETAASEIVEPSTSELIVNTECATAESTDASEATTDETATETTSEPESVVEEKPTTIPEPVPRIDFHNIETILKKVDEILESKGEELDKKEELEAKKEDDCDNEEDESDDEDEDDEDEVKEEVTVEGATAAETSTTSASSSNQTDIDAAEGASLAPRIDALNRQNSKIEKFELIFEKIARENKSTQTDFSVFMLSSFGLQYIKPEGFIPTYLDPCVEFPIVMATRMAFKALDN